VEDLRFEDSPHHFTEESFVAVCAETQHPGGSPEEFLRGAIEFANQKMTGTLCASLTIPRDFGSKHGQLLDNCIDELRYGTVCVNQWSGLSYALISPAWGAFPGATIDDPQSGIGSVHNTFLLDGFEKSVLSGPLIDLLKPAWFADHRKSRKLAEHLVSYYTSPSLWKLSQLSIAGATG
jgi:aldehyde dehydrogenase (NAD(P)+)